MNKIINCKEIMVKECIENLIKDTKGCKCEKCKNDIAALALNNLKPCYVTTKLGEVMTKIKNTEQQEETNIIVEVTKAINIVQKNPKH
ncbi:MAG: late competence development ComFB family protein [Clostridium sp.]|nr:late competence development ComFB family protein [Clostridium sp.]